MPTEPESSTATAETTGHGEGRTFVRGFHGVRYQVRDVSRAVAFYTGHFGFTLTAARRAASVPRGAPATP